MLKTIINLKTINIDTDSIYRTLQSVLKGRKIYCPVSHEEISRSKDENKTNLAIIIHENHINLWSTEELNSLANEGFTLISFDDPKKFLDEVFNNNFICSL